MRVAQPVCAEWAGLIHVYVLAVRHERRFPAASAFVGTYPANFTLPGLPGANENSLLRGGCETAKWGLERVSRTKADLNKAAGAATFTGFGTQTPDRTWSW